MHDRVAMVRQSMGIDSEPELSIPTLEVDVLRLAYGTGPSRFAYDRQW